MMSVVPALAACFMKVAATGWLCVVFEPMMKMASVSRQSEKGLDTEPLPTCSIKAATDEA